MKSKMAEMIQPSAFSLQPSGESAARGRILIVDDEEVISGTLHEFLQGEQFEVATASDMPGALAQVESFGPDVVLCDVQLPGGDGLTVLERSLRIRPETLFIMITAYATVENAVAAFRRGAQDYLMKPVLFEDLLAKLDRLIAYRRLLMENQALRRQLHPQGDLDALVGESPPMQAVKTMIRKVGPTRSTVLITGESGTGKELVAHALHAAGPDPEGLFLAVNCAAIPHDLLENQLFGHVRGAFTGAERDHAGLFVAAGSGTVFLDEIGELSRSTQAKLLRAIENKEVLPVGATRPVSFQARLLTATNKDLTAEVAAQRFRADLYYRLNVVTIHLPPLRDRREDIPALAESTLRRVDPGRAWTLSVPLRRLLVSPALEWSGNVRQLERVVERARERAVLRDPEATVLTPEHLEARDLGQVRPDAPPSGAGTPEPPAALSVVWQRLQAERASIDEREEGVLRQALTQSGGVVAQAARELGIARTTLSSRIDVLGIRGVRRSEPAK
jgi:DNA-binding NtrC family response regulator